MSRQLRLLLSIGLGFIFSYTACHDQFFFCAWISLAGLIWICHETTAFNATSCGFLFGLTWLLLAYDWAVPAFSHYLHIEWWVATLLFLIPATWESLLFALIGLASCLLGSSGRLWLLPFVITVCDRHWPKFFPWQLGLSQSDLFVCIQAADVSGLSTLTFWLSCLACTSTFLGHLVFDRSRVKIQTLNASAAATGGDEWATSTTELSSHTAIDREECVCPDSTAREWLLDLQALMTLTFFLVVIVLVPVYGAMRASAAPDVNEIPGDRLMIGAIQVRGANYNSLEKLRAATNALSPTPDLVCWPEGVLGEYHVDLRSFADADHARERSRRPFRHFSELYDISTSVIAGGTTFTDFERGSGLCFNTAFLIASDDVILDCYHKQALMPVGEYLPFDEFLPQLRSWFGMTDRLKPGASSRPLELPDGTKLGILICYEDTVPSIARQEVREGAEVLIGLADLRAFQDPKTLRQHFRLARLRAIENRRHLITCTSTGMTANVDPWGRIIDQLPLQEESSMCTPVKRYREQSLYTRYGDWISQLSLVVTALSLLVSFLSKHTGLAPQITHNLNGPA